MCENNVLPTKLQTRRNLRCTETTSPNCTYESNVETNYIQI